MLFFSFGMTMMSVILFSLIGSQNSASIKNPMLCTAITGGILCFLAVLNPIAAGIVKKFRGRLTEREKTERLVALAAAETENPGRAAKRMRIRYFLGCVYAVLVPALAAAFTLFVAAWQVISVYTFAAIFFMYCALERFFNLMGGDRGFAASAVDTPQIVGLVYETAAELNVRLGKNLRLIPSNDCNAGIVVSRYVSRLILGAPLGAVLTQEEFRQVLIHEFTHAKSKNTRLQVRSNGLSVYFSSPPKYIFGKLNFLYRLPAVLFPAAFSEYSTAAGPSMELEADAGTLEYGDPQIMADALAKITAYGFFMKEYRKNIYAEATVPEHVCSTTTRAFLEAYERRRGEWEKYLPLGLPYKLSSHPSLNERCRALGVSGCSLGPLSDSPSWRKEWEGIGKLADEPIKDRMKSDYTRRRNREYVIPNAVVSGYSPDKNYGVAELNSFMNNFMMLCEYEKAAEIADRVIAASDSDRDISCALYTSGTVRLTKYDRTGIDLILRAAKVNRSYAVAATAAAGEFARMMGLKDDLERCRDITPEAAQEVKETVMRKGKLRLFTRLTPSTLPDERKKTLAADIGCLSLGTVKTAYLCEQRIRKDFTAQLVILKFDGGYRKEDIDDILLSVNRYLFDQPDSEKFLALRHSIGIGTHMRGRCRLFRQRDIAAS